jgi:Secretion system C-terminal sorting domain
MRKIYFTFLLAISSFSYGQFFENFDGVTTPALPAGWVSFRGTDDAGTAFDWTTATTRPYSAPNCAFVRYQAGGLYEDWLVTPLIDLTNYTGSTLTFYGGQQYTVDYATIYDIRVSTASQTTHGDFSSAQTFAETDFTTGTTFGPGDLKTVDLSAYDGQQIYIAFVMIQNDGDNWFLDDPTVTGTLSNDYFERYSTAISPNPTNGLVTIQSNEPIESVNVIGLLGNVVRSYQNTNSVDLSNLEDGSYILSITSVNGTVSKQKIIKN